MDIDLQPPGPLTTGGLRVTALGGISEIGRNMTVFEHLGRLLIIDCGVMFPTHDEPGVDLILPDLRHIDHRLDDVEALVLTHAHEDHIGAIPFLLKLRPDIPVVGSKFTLALVAAKCREHRVKPVFIQVAEGMRTTHGVFECEYFAVNHSIPDALAIAVRSGAGTVLHTGDIKLDQLPLDRRPTDLPGMSRLGDAGVDLFLCDSTNAEIPGVGPSESEIGPTLHRLIRGASGRVIVACFASNVDRVQQIIDAATALGRRVSFVGRSMVRNMGIAADLGYLKVPDGVLIEAKKAADLPDNKLVYMSTGSQGEPMAVLARMANLEHQIEVGKGDTVILASSLIPGNENAVYRVINGLMKLGATVIHKGNAKVHVSGHAAAGELLYVYNILKPKNVLPVHGEQRHLVANANLAMQTGVPEENTIIGEDGTVIDLKDGVATVVGQLDLGYVYVDGSSVGEITDADLKDRRILAEEGFISIFVAIDMQTGRVIVGPEIQARGFAEDEDVFDEVKPQIVKALTDASFNGTRDTHAYAQVIRRTVGRWVNTQHRRRPMIIPVVIEA